MSVAALNDTHRPNRTAIAVVVLMHGAAITALGLSKMEVIENPFSPTTVVDIKLPDPKPPEPKPIEKVTPRVEPRHVSVVTAPQPVVVTPVRFADLLPVDPNPQPIAEPYSPPGPVTVEPSPPLPAEAKKIESARAKANLSSYVSDSDYPAAALRAEDQGTTRFRLTVGADGRVSVCTITGSSGSSALDAATCRIMKSRARFTPARNSDGQPTGDTVTNAIRWVLPD